MVEQILMKLFTVSDPFTMSLLEGLDQNLDRVHKVLLIFGLLITIYSNIKRKDDKSDDLK